MTLSQSSSSGWCRSRLDGGADCLSVDVSESLKRFLCIWAASSAEMRPTFRRPVNYSSRLWVESASRLWSCVLALAQVSLSTFSTKDCNTADKSTFGGSLPGARRFGGSVGHSASFPDESGLTWVCQGDSSVPWTASL